jgi:outer membrane lipoprotein SlyB
MSIGEDVGSYAGGVLGGAAATFLGQPEFAVAATKVGSEIGKFVGREGEKAVIKGAKRLFEGKPK